MRRCVAFQDSHELEVKGCEYNTTAKAEREIVNRGINGSVKRAWKRTPPPNHFTETRVWERERWIKSLSPYSLMMLMRKTENMFNVCFVNQKNCPIHSIMYTLMSSIYSLFTCCHGILSKLYVSHRSDWVSLMSRKKVDQKCLNKMDIFLENVLWRNVPHPSHLRFLIRSWQDVFRWWHQLHQEHTTMLHL